MCNKCGSEMKIVNIIRDERGVIEIEKKCVHCGYHTNWAYGSTEVLDEGDKDEQYGYED